MRNPEFQLVAWTLRFYMQVETHAAIAGATSATKPARTADASRTRGTAKKR